MAGQATKVVESDPVPVVTVLCVSPAQDDHLLLQNMFSRPKWTQNSDFKWVLDATLSLEAAVSALQEKTFSIVLCEAELLSGTWKDLLEHLWAHPDPPLMIVTSRLADEYLWVDALHLGVYDVLRKPFDTEELSRVLTLASHRWKHRRERR